MVVYYLVNVLIIGIRGQNMFTDFVFVKHPQHTEKIIGKIIPEWNIIKNLVLEITL